MALELNRVIRLETNNRQMLDINEGQSFRYIMRKYKEMPTITPQPPPSSSSESLQGIGAFRTNTDTLNFREVSTFRFNAPQNINMAATRTDAVPARINRMFMIPQVNADAIPPPPLAPDTFERLRMVTPSTNRIIYHSYDVPRREEVFITRYLKLPYPENITPEMAKMFGMLRNERRLMLQQYYAFIMRIINNIADKKMKELKTRYPEPYIRDRAMAYNISVMQRETIINNLKRQYNTNSWREDPRLR